MITVVIPALNEASTIGCVVQFAWRDPSVSQVVVVDDGSIDETPRLARAAGASVILSTMLGKGVSMEEGLREAVNEIILYLDGDLKVLQPELVARMTKPLLDNHADFVKAQFTRKAGRVTTLTARPLLRIFFPELAHLDQPLGGIIAARRSLLARLRFENDYGVDIGLLLDAAAARARITEVHIGHVEHASHPLEALGDMATQVARTVLDRAGRHGRLNRGQLHEMLEAEHLVQAELPAVLRRADRGQRLALFDMDGVLLDGRFIVELARITGREEELAKFLDHQTLEADDRSQRIAGVFAGIRKEVFEQAAREIPLIPGACETVVALRKAGYCVGLVTDSFSIAAETVRRRVFADFSVAHLTGFSAGKSIGRLIPAPAMAHPEGCPRHAHCKVNVLHHLTKQMGIGREHVLAVGDGANDICLLREAGISVAFRPKSPQVRRAAQFVVRGRLSNILPLLDDLASTRLILPPAVSPAVAAGEAVA